MKELFRLRAAAFMGRDKSDFGQMASINWESGGSQNTQHGVIMSGLLGDWILNLSVLKVYVIKILLAHRWSFSSSSTFNSLTFHLLIIKIAHKSDFKVLAPNQMLICASREKLLFNREFQLPELNFEDH